VRYGDPIVVKLLLKAGVSPNSINAKGDSALCTAIMFCPEINEKPSVSMGVIRLFAPAKYEDVAKCLIEAGADVNFRRQSGRNLLHLALFTWKLTAFQILLDSGADFEQTDPSNGRSLLFNLLELECGGHESEYFPFLEPLLRAGVKHGDLELKFARVAGLGRTERLLRSRG